MGNSLILIILSLCLSSLFIAMLMVPEIKDDFEIITINSLDRHNFYREKHNVSFLKISEKLNKVSQDWANKLAQNNNFFHRSNGVYGENMYAVFGTKKPGSWGVDAVNSWYNEIKYFNFQGTEEEMIASKKAFHMTQLLWKNSKELGQGASKNLKSGNVYVVCNYYPRGNYLYKFKENVLPPRNN